MGNTKMNIKTNNSLPSGFEKLKTEKPYINLGKLAEGEYRFRIVQRPIAGWIDWLDKKPFRFTPDNKPRTSFDPTKPVKPFWAVHVWDYQKEGLYIMEITQNSIRKSLETLALNEDWGDLTGFDFKIKKEGAGIDTNYSVIPIPPKPLAEHIRMALESSKVRLEALYEGKDPWNDLEALEEVNSSLPGESPRITEAQEGDLSFLLSQIKDPGYVKKLLFRLNVSEIYELDPKHYDRVIKELENKIKSEAAA
jgi:hypothetical protein